MASAHVHNSDDACPGKDDAGRVSSSGADEAWQVAHADFAPINGNNDVAWVHHAVLVSRAARDEPLHEAALPHLETKA